MQGVAAVKRQGSIPAHAGEPSQRPPVSSRRGVYPRPRGGTTTRGLPRPATSGLSPPTRGNRAAEVRESPIIGSIPAHAGEPWICTPPPHGDTVYPRPRGGTSIAPTPALDVGGLSPPTRGNRKWTPASSYAPWSIPAHAGEPKQLPRERDSRRVYPRPRGGTLEYHAPPLGCEGLSPPTRGNRLQRLVRIISFGSIPAHAGEPRPKPNPRAADGVYPRPRGGTGRRGVRSVEREGLSPPTRGNLAVFSFIPTRMGSIPAHAGEPNQPPAAQGQGEVYPRPRGGTGLLRAESAFGGGLSPPTRGNRQRIARCPGRRRSIPAHAGEPRRQFCRARSARVYPRPRGGTG